MIDLHLHLDGSISKEDYLFLSKKNNISLPKDFPNCIYVSNDCPSLEEYLTRFDLSGEILQDEFSLAYVTTSLLNRLYEMGLIYTEIRFAPLLHTNKGLNQLQVTKAVVKGLKEGLKGKQDFDANIILCCMRHADEKINMETIEVANILKNEKVVAVDLAGAESLHPSTYYKNIFDLAKKYKLNITIHAGEATGSDEIMMAIDNGATRIGHGVHLSLDEQSIKKVKDHNVLFEFCPTSNLQTKSLKKYEDVPINGFISNNIPFSINADNMTVSNTDCLKEMEIIKKTFNLTKQDVLKLYKNACEHAFISEKQKEIIFKQIESKLL